MLWNAARLADRIERLSRISVKEREAIAARVRTPYSENSERNGDLAHLIRSVFGQM